MALQARAEATRRRILDSAVDLFDELGYGETGLADVLHRAGVSKGAFYYHFDSKEAVATAIIADFRDKVATSARQFYSPSTPLIESVITSTFDSAAIMASVKSARVGQELLQGLSQISSMASQTYREWTEEYVGLVARAIEPWATARGIEANEAAEAIWVGILGCHLLTAATGEDHLVRLARSWKLTLKVLAPSDELDRYIARIDEVVAGYSAFV